MAKPTNKYRFTVEYNGEFKKSKFYLNDVEIPVKSVALLGSELDGLNFSLGITNELEIPEIKSDPIPLGVSLEDFLPTEVAYVSSAILPLDLDGKALGMLIEQGCDGIIPVFKRKEYAEKFGDGVYEEINTVWEDDEC